MSERIDALSLFVDGLLSWEEGQQAKTCRNASSHFFTTAAEKWRKAAAATPIGHNSAIALENAFLAMLHQRTNRAAYVFAKAHGIKTGVNRAGEAPNTNWLEGGTPINLAEHIGHKTAQRNAPTTQRDEPPIKRVPPPIEIPGPFASPLVHFQTGHSAWEKASAAKTPHTIKKELLQIAYDCWVFAAKNALVKANRMTALSNAYLASSKVNNAGETYELRRQLFLDHAVPDLTSDPDKTWDSDAEAAAAPPIGNSSAIVRLVATELPTNPTAPRNASQDTIPQEASKPTNTSGANANQPRSIDYGKVVWEKAWMLHGLSNITRDPTKTELIQAALETWLAAANSTSTRQNQQTARINAVITAERLENASKVADILAAHQLTPTMVPSNRKLIRAWVD